MTTAALWLYLSLCSAAPGNRFASDYDRWVVAINTRYSRIGNSGFDVKEQRAWVQMQRSFKQLKRKYDAVYKGR